MKIFMISIYLCCVGSISAQKIDVTFPDLLIKRFENYGNKIDLITFLKKPGNYTLEEQKRAARYLAFHLVNELTEAKYPKKEIDRISEITWKQCLSIKNYDLALYITKLMKANGLSRYIEPSLDDIWESYKSGTKEIDERFAYCDLFLGHKEWAKQHLEHFIEKYHKAEFVYDQNRYNDKVFWVKFLFELAPENPQIVHILEVELLEMKEKLIHEHEERSNSAYLLLAKLRKDLKLHPVDINKNPEFLMLPEYGMEYFVKIRKNPKNVNVESLENLYYLIHSDFPSYPVQNQAIETLKVLGISDLRTIQLYLSLIKDSRKGRFDLRNEGQQALHSLQPRDQDVMDFLIKTLTTSTLRPELYHCLSLLRKFDRKSKVEASSSYKQVFNHLKKVDSSLLSTLFDICRDISFECPLEMKNIIYSFLNKGEPIYRGIHEIVAPDLYYSATVACIKFKFSKEKETAILKAVVDISQNTRHLRSYLPIIYACFHLERGQELLSFLPKGRKNWYILAIKPVSLKDTRPMGETWGTELNAFTLFLDCLLKYQTAKEAKGYIPTLKEMREDINLENIWPKIDLTLKALQ